MRNVISAVLVTTDNRTFPEGVVCLAIATLKGKLATTVIQKQVNVTVSQELRVNNARSVKNHDMFWKNSNAHVSVRFEFIGCVVRVYYFFQLVILVASGY